MLLRMEPNCLRFHSRFPAAEKCSGSLSTKVMSMKFPTFCFPDRCVTDFLLRMCCITDDAADPLPATRSASASTPAEMQKSSSRLDFSNDRSGQPRSATASRTRFEILLARQFATSDSSAKRSSSINSVITKPHRHGQSHAMSAATQKYKCE